MEVIRDHLVALYGRPLGNATFEKLRARLLPAPDTRGRLHVSAWGRGPLSARDAILITYGDQLREAERATLRTLAEFCDRHLRGVVSGIHLLPFYPYSSDDGLSVIDYRRVNPALGDWDDVARAGQGLTFLGHTAPALLLGGIVGVVAVRDWLRAGQPATTSRAQIATDFGLIAAFALLVSLPLLVSIVGHYQLHTLNAAPGSWIYDPLLLSNVGELYNLVVIAQPLLIGGAVIGLVVLLRQHSQNVERLIVLAWLLMAALLLGYSYLGQIAAQHDVTLPSIVTGFHSVFYLHAGLALLFGLGLVWVCRRSGDFLARIRPIFSSFQLYYTPSGLDEVSRFFSIIISSLRDFLHSNLRLIQCIKCLPLYSP